MWGKLPLLFFFLLDQFIPLSQGAGAGVDHCFSEHAGFTTPAGGALDNHLCGRCQEKRFQNVFPTLLVALWYNPVVCDVVSCFWLLFCSQYIDLYHYYKKIIKMLTCCVLTAETIIRCTQTIRFRVGGHAARTTSISQDHALRNNSYI